MKIEDTSKTDRVQLDRMDPGECFRLGTRHYVLTDKISPSIWASGKNWRNVSVVDLADGSLGELPAETSVAPVSAKVVIG